MVSNFLCGAWPVYGSLRCWLLWWCLALASLHAHAQNVHVVTYQKTAAFADVREALLDALTNRGLVVSYHAHIGDMLARTGKDIGADRPLYRHAEALEFCSAVLSRSMMEADPSAIAFCPFTLVIYETVAKPGVVNIGYRRLPDTGTAAKAAQQVQKLLDEIAREAAQ